MNSDFVILPRDADFFMSPQVDKLAEALNKAQAVMEHAKKDKENPFHKSKYADLAGCLDTSKGPLAENGLSVSQYPVESEKGAGLVTVLMHVSGQLIGGRMGMRPIKDDPQGVASCVTYMRRYAHAAAVGLAQEDDDGNQASNPKKPGASKAQDIVYTGKGADRQVVMGIFEKYGVKDKNQMVALNEILVGQPMSKLEGIVKTNVGQ